MGFLNNLFQKATHNIFLYHPDMRLATEANKDYNGEYISTLLTCQKVIAQQLAKLPLEVYTNDAAKGKVKHKDHKLYKLLHTAPNQYTTSYNFFQEMIMLMLQYGNSFAKIHRNGNKVESFEIIHPTEILGHKIKNNQLYFYRRKADAGKGETLNSFDVLHFKFVSNDGVMGLNVVDALFSELNNIWQGRTTLNSTYRNGLNVDKYISSDASNFAGKNVKEAVENIKSEYAGAVNSRKVPVLPAGFRINSISSGNIADAQILQSMDFSKKDIAALFGVPVHLLNSENGSYSTVEQNNISFKSNTLQPLARMMKQELEHKLLTDKEVANGVSIEYNLSAMVEADMVTRVNYFKSLQSMGVITANEIARLEGFETFDGGDKHYLQAQYIAVEDQQQTTPVVEEPATPEPEHDKKEDDLNEGNENTI